MNRRWLERIDQLRYDDPKGALEHLASRAASTPTELEPLFFGVCSSTYRNLSSQSRNAQPVLAKASKHIDIGLYLARQHNNAPAVADLLLRQSYLVSEDGDYAHSLELAERANAIFERADDTTGRGKSLADQGMYLYYLDRPKEAINAYAAALKILPLREERCRCSAHQGTGACFLKLGQPHEALRNASVAWQCAPDSSAYKAKIHWFQATVLIELSEFERAEACLRDVIEIFRRLHYGETALASCDLVRVQLLRGNYQSAWESANAVHELIIPLSGHRIVAGALVELVRGGRQALDLQLINKVKSAIQDERERLEWRSLSADD